MMKPLSRVLPPASWLLAVISSLPGQGICSESRLVVTEVPSHTTWCVTSSLTGAAAEDTGAHASLRSNALGTLDDAVSAAGASSTGTPFIGDIIRDPGQDPSTRKLFIDVCVAVPASVRGLSSNPVKEVHYPKATVAAVLCPAYELGSCLARVRDKVKSANPNLSAAAIASWKWRTTFSAEERSDPTSVGMAAAATLSRPIRFRPEVSVIGDLTLPDPKVLRPLITQRRGQAIATSFVEPPWIFAVIFIPSDVQINGE